MITRRDFLISTANASAGFAIASQFPRSAAAQTSETERNKAIVRAYKETAKTKSAAALQACRPRSMPRANRTCASRSATRKPKSRRPPPHRPRRCRWERRRCRLCRREPR